MQGNRTIHNVELNKMHIMHIIMKWSCYSLFTVINMIKPLDNKYLIFKKLYEYNEV